ncbi:MAG: DUF3592 domain-containing protein [Pseudodonghicola sp.]|nr:DUF3592 domain-containing protein [Pseudodonghicola sp.]
MDGKKQSVASVVWRQQGWVFALLVVAGIGLGAIRISSHQTAVEFSKNGIEVIGEITHMKDYTSSNRRKFNVSYTFVTAADPYNTGSQLVSEPFYKTLTDGGAIRVWYLPTDPTVNAVDLDKLTNGVGLTMMIAVGLILVGSVGGGFAIQRARANVQSSRDRGAESR